MMSFFGCSYYRSGPSRAILILGKFTYMLRLENFFSRQNNNRACLHLFAVETLKEFGQWSNRLVLFTVTSINQ